MKEKTNQDDASPSSEAVNREERVKALVNS